MDMGAGRAMRADEASVFCEQVSLLLAAGMPIYEGMEALAEGYEGMREYPRMKRMAEEVGKDGDLSGAMRRSGMFPSYLVEMTLVGERAGKLEWAMNELSQYYRREGRVFRALRSAVTYPVVLITMMACVIGVLIMKVMPVFRQVFASLGLDAGVSADSLLRVGMDIGYIVLVASAVLLTLALVAFVLTLTPARDKVTRFITRVFPLARRLTERIAAQRFAGVMSMMIGSGFPIEEALRFAPTIVEPGFVREKLEKVEKMTSAGRSFPEAITDVGLFAPVYNRMVVVGFAAGQADAALAKVAEAYEDQVDDSFSKLVSTIEPTLVALLSVLVGAILLSVMLPMAGVLTGLM